MNVPNLINTSLPGVPKLGSLPTEAEIRTADLESASTKEKDEATREAEQEVEQGQQEATPGTGENAAAFVRRNPH